MNLAQLVVDGAAVLLVLAAGVALGRHLEPTPAPVVREVPAPAPYGDFDDVTLIMRSTMGTTFRLLCDMHFPPAPEPRTAECEYVDP